MSRSSGRPVLFLDVDGTLITFKARPGSGSVPGEIVGNQEEVARGLHWMTVELVRWAAGRPFVWLDDEITDADRRWVVAHHVQRVLLHRVDPLVGLTDADFTLIRYWSADVGTARVDGCLP